VFKMHEHREKHERENAPDRGTLEESESSGLLDKVNPFKDDIDDIDMSHGDVFEFNLPSYMSVHEKQTHMPVYLSTFSDYNELVIMFGYVTMFAMALPIGSALCFLNNCIEIRSDAFKLVNVFQRPYYKGAQDIGTWKSILYITVVLAVLVNCGMVCLTSNIFIRNHWVRPDQFGIVEMIAAVFLAEHCLLIFLSLAADFIPDEAPWVGYQVMRLEDKVAEVLETEDDTDRSREIEHKYRMKMELIDDHDVANMEDTQIYEWRRRPQYGSGSLEKAQPPRSEPAPKSQKDKKVRQEAKWIAEKARQEAKRKTRLDELANYRLY